MGVARKAVGTSASPVEQAIRNGPVPRAIPWARNYSTYRLFGSAGLTTRQAEISPCCTVTNALLSPVWAQNSK